MDDDIILNISHTFTVGEGRGAIVWQHVTVGFGKYFVSHGDLHRACINDNKNSGA